MSWKYDARLISSLINSSSKKQNRVFKTQFWNLKNNKPEEVQIWWRRTEGGTIWWWRTEGGTIWWRRTDERSDDEEQRRNGEEERWTIGVFKSAWKRTLDELRRLQGRRSETRVLKVKLEFHVDFLPHQLSPLTNRDLKTRVLSWNSNFRHLRW